MFDRNQRAKGERHAPPDAMPQAKRQQRRQHNRPSVPD